MGMTEVAEQAPDAAPRGRPRSSEADLAIFEATMGLLLEVGYEGLTMAGVAHRAGVSTATLALNLKCGRAMLLETAADARLVERISKALAKYIGDHFERPAN